MPWQRCSFNTVVSVLEVFFLVKIKIIKNYPWPCKWPFGSPRFLLCCCDGLWVPVAAVSCTSFPWGAVAGQLPELGFGHCSSVSPFSFFSLKEKNTVIIPRLSRDEQGSLIFLLSSPPFWEHGLSACLLPCYSFEFRKPGINMEVFNTSVFSPKTKSGCPCLFNSDFSCIHQ